MFGPVLREMLRTGATLGHHPTVHIAVESSAATPGTTVLDAVARAPHDRADEPFEPVGGAAASNLINVPALTTLVRSFAAQYYGDAEATAAFATQTLAEIKPGERLLLAAGTPTPRRGTGGQPGHGEKARQPPAGQARRG